MNPSLSPTVPKSRRCHDKACARDELMLDHLYDQVLALHDEIVAFETSMQAGLDHLHQGRHASARNLLHYVAFRQRDVRDLQGQLSALGFSSLGRSEACILPTLRQVLAILGRLTEKSPLGIGAKPVSALEDGKIILARNTEGLFGPSPAGRLVRIMVTMSTQAAHRYEHVRELLAHGMDCMRINCAHDDASDWTQMIEHVRRAQQELQRSCSVLMDLGGPKLRTGPIAQGPAIHKWKPTRGVVDSGEWCVFHSPLTTLHYSRPRHRP